MIRSVAGSESDQCLTWPSSAGRIEAVAVAIEDQALRRGEMARQLRLALAAFPVKHHNPLAAGHRQPLAVGADGQGAGVVEERREVQRAIRSGRGGRRTEVIAVRFDGFARGRVQHDDPSLRGSRLARTGRDYPLIPVGDQDLPAVGRNGHGAGVGVFRPVLAEDRFQQLQLPRLRNVPGLQLKAAGAGIRERKATRRDTAAGEDFGKSPFRPDVDLPHDGNQAIVAGREGRVGHAARNAVDQGDQLAAQRIADLDSRTITSFISPWGPGHIITLITATRRPSPLSTKRSTSQGNWASRFCCVMLQSSTGPRIAGERIATGRTSRWSPSGRKAT